MSKEDSEAMGTSFPICCQGHYLLYRLPRRFTNRQHPGGLPERPKGADCKSVGVCLRRFEPCTRHEGDGRGVSRSSCADRLAFVILCGCASLAASGGSATR